MRIGAGDADVEDARDSQVQGGKGVTAESIDEPRRAQTPPASDALSGRGHEQRLSPPRDERAGAELVGDGPAAGSPFGQLTS
jgi:hypothetical protein